MAVPTDPVDRQDNNLHLPEHGLVERLQPALSDGGVGLGEALVSHEVVNLAPEKHNAKLGSRRRRTQCRTLPAPYTTLSTMSMLVLQPRMITILFVQCVPDILPPTLLALGLFTVTVV